MEYIKIPIVKKDTIEVSQKKDKDIAQMSREEKLRKFKLTKEDIKEFKSQIKHVRINVSQEYGSLLFAAISEKEADPNIVYGLIVSGADINYCNNFDLSSLIHIAVLNNDLATFLMLVRAGADINVQNHAGYTPIMYASMFNFKEILEILILIGADISIKNNDGQTAHDIAKSKGSNECIEILNKVANNMTECTAEEATDRFIKDAEKVLNNMTKNRQLTRKKSEFKRI